VTHLKREALFWERYDSNTVKCLLCPHNCLLKEKQSGICNSRKNENGTLVSLNYGDVVVKKVDTLGKRLLFYGNHEDPVLSLGSWGCNLCCDWCYNWEIARLKPLHLVKKYSPEEIRNEVLYLRKTKGVQTIVFTYNEPLVWVEFIIDICEILKSGIDIVLNTNLHVNEKPLLRIIPFVSALNIDLKAFSSFKYALGPKGHFDAVLKNLKLCVEHGKYVEVTFPLIKGFNDDADEFEDLVAFLCKISSEIPLQIRKGYPTYRHFESSPSEDELQYFRAIASKYLKHVELVFEEQ